jgi:hypothetical protein
MRIYDLLLKAPPGQARWADYLGEAARRLDVDLASQRQVDAELEALRTLVAHVRGLVLGNADGSSSMAASLSMVVELLEGRIDTATANGVHWGTRSTLVATLSHFPELKTKLELLGSGRNADLIED